MTTINAKIEKLHYRTVITAGENTIISDEPLRDGGKGEGFSPYSLILASLGSCTAITLRMYADRKNIPLDSCEVNVTLFFENGKSHFKKNIILNGDLDDSQRQALLKIADKCFIHKLLTHPIEINTELL